MDTELSVKTAVAENLFLNIDDIKVTDNFINDYDIDSLDLTEITMDLENKLKIKIPLSYLTSNLKTVQDLIDLVNRIVTGEQLKINTESGCSKYGNLII